MWFSYPRSGAGVFFFLNCFNSPNSSVAPLYLCFPRNQIRANIDTNPHFSNDAEANAAGSGHQAEVHAYAIHARQIRK